MRHPTTYAVLHRTYITKRILLIVLLVLGTAVGGPKYENSTDHTYKTCYKRSMYTRLPFYAEMIKAAVGQEDGKDYCGN